MFPHLKQNRYGIYCFRLIFTQAVRSLPDAPKELTLSLMTRDKDEAYERYLQLYPHARALRESLHLDVLKGDTTVSTLKLKVAALKKSIPLREQIKEKDDQLWQLRKSHRNAQRVNDAQWSEIQSLKENNLRLTGQVEELRRMQIMPVHDAVRPISPPVSNSQYPKAVPSNTRAAASKPKSNRSQTLSAYVRRFLDYEQQHEIHGKHTQEARHSYLMRFLDIVGHTLPITELTATQFRHYRDMIHRIPSNFDKQGFTIPSAKSQRPAWFKKTIKAWEGKTLSGQGIESHFKHVRVFLRWAKREHYLQEDFVPLISASKRRKQETHTTVVNFMPDDLTKLFIEGPLYGDVLPARDQSKPWQFWIPLIALLTGMRSEEIGALTLGNLIQHGGFWCVRLERSKTKAGERTFPLPQRLIDAGLLDYHQSLLVEYNGDLNQSLFPQLERKGGEYSNRIGQFFNRNRNGKLKDGTPRWEGYLHKCGVENPSDTETLKFHSFRHGFITKLFEGKLPSTGAALPLDLIRNLVGHKSNFSKYGVSGDSWNTVTNASYNHVDRVALPTQTEWFSLMKEAMDAMDFGIDLSAVSFARFQTRQAART